MPLNSGLLHCRQIAYHPSHEGARYIVGPYKIPYEQAHVANKSLESARLNILGPCFQPRHTLLLKIAITIYLREQTMTQEV